MVTVLGGTALKMTVRVLSKPESMNSSVNFSMTAGGCGHRALFVRGLDDALRSTTWEDPMRIAVIYRSVYSVFALLQACRKA